MFYTLKKTEILRSKHSFDEVFRHGKAVESNYLRGLVFIAPESSRAPKPRIIVGFATQRGLLNAVARNRLKRLMRESYRLNKNVLLPKAKKSKLDVSLIFIYAPKIDVPISNISFSGIQNDLRIILSTIASRWFS